MSHALPGPSALERRLTFATASALIATFAAMPLAGYAQITGTFYTEASVSRTETYIDTAVTRRVDLYSTRLIGRIDGNPSIFFDQTYSFAFADPVVQGAVPTVQQILAGQTSDPLAFGAPALLGSSTGFISSQVSTEIVQSTVTGTQAGSIIVFGNIAGSTLPYGDLGICQGLQGPGPSNPVATGLYPFGCSGGNPSILTFFGGDTAVVTNINTDYLIARNLVTTDTFRTDAIYEIVGRAVSNAVPLPMTTMLLLAGLSAAWATSGRRRIA